VAYIEIRAAEEDHPWPFTAHFMEPSAGGGESIAHDYGDSPREAVAALRESCPGARDILIVVGP
jgi:hypothetical protein